jgi:hypothetical protein
MTVPTRLTAGDTWTWTHTVADYPASTWTGTYYVQNTEQSFDVAASASGDDFSVTVEAATTALRMPGKYRWVLLVTADGVRHTADTGEVEILADPAYATSVEFRTNARQRYDMIEAYLADPTNLAAASYSIGGRSLSRWSRTELMSEWSRLKQELQSEAAVDRMAKGLGNPRRLYVRFDRA